MLNGSQATAAAASPPLRSQPAPSPITDLVPIASSRSLGWEPLLMEEFQQPPGGAEYGVAASGHSIALCLAPRPYRIRQVVGDRRYVGLYSKGDISITPAGIPAAYHAEGDDHYLHLEVPRSLLQQVAQEVIAIDPDRVELVTEFRVRDPQLEQILLLLRSELHQPDGRAGRLYVESLANALIVSLLRQYATTAPRVALYEGGLGDRQIMQVADYIHAHLAREIKLAELAGVVGLSPFHFSRLFKQAMGISPHQYLRQQRLDRAQHLLKQSQLPIAEIALQCGFSNQSHLGKAFRDLTGTTPSQYRKG